jgi:hypothetical protein
MVSDLLGAKKRIPKIIGHPISLLLTFLIDEQHNYNPKVGNIMQSYKELISCPQHKLEKRELKTMTEKKLYELIAKTLGEQNLLEPSFVDFFA